MRIAGLQKLTLLDFPGHTAATVFTPGCNLRCPFCHNADLVIGGSFPTYPLDDFWAFLDRRQGLLDGVCITGGEPLLQPDLATFCAQVRERGFKVKLDTNGCFPARLRDLIQAHVIDYVALDAKNAPHRYAESVGMPDHDGSTVRESIDALTDAKIGYELRTTVVRELHGEEDLLQLAQWIEGRTPAWFLQNFEDGDGVLGGAGRLHPWDPDSLRALMPRLRAIVPSVRLRGLDE